MAEEGLKKTKNDLIHIGCPIPFDIEIFLKDLNSLLEAAYPNIHSGWNDRGNCKVLYLSDASVHQQNVRKHWIKHVLFFQELMKKDCYSL